MNLIPQAYSPAALKGWRYNIRFALSALKAERADAKLPPDQRSRYGVDLAPHATASNKAMLERLWPKRHIGAGMAKHYK